MATGIFIDGYGSIDGYSSYAGASYFAPPAYDPAYDDVMETRSAGGSRRWSHKPIPPNEYEGQWDAKAARGVGRNTGWDYAPPPSRSKSEEPDPIKQYEDITKKIREIEDLAKVIQTPEERLKDLEAEMKRIQQEIDELIEQETRPSSGKSAPRK